MLLRLLPDQISSYWPTIKQTLQDTAPEITPYGLTLVLENLLSGNMQCWMEVEPLEEGVELYAVLVTSVFRDSFFQQNCLRICSFYGFKDLSPERWQAGAETIIAFAHGEDCLFLEAITDRVGLTELSKKFGCKTRYHISMEVSNGHGRG